LSITILGISAYYHGSAAALLVDNDIAAAVQEERFTRKKHDAGFPANAVRYCVSQAGGFEHVDYVVFYDKPLVKFERLLEIYLSFAPKGFFSFVAATPIWLKGKVFLKE
jgi:carbamoyltransferase